MRCWYPVSPRRRVEGAVAGGRIQFVESHQFGAEQEALTLALIEAVSRRAIW